MEKRLTIFSRLSPAKTTEVFDTYWKFAAERQAIFFKRVKGIECPWTNDSILKNYRFTNVYRASDRVSQYLIKEVIYKGNQSPREVFFRIMLFKTFNKIGTWKLLFEKLGDISYSTYSFEKYDKVLNEAMKMGIAIYSAAYIMTSGKTAFHYEKKYQNHLKLLELMFKKDVPSKILDLKSMSALFELLRSLPTIGNFLAYQYAIDINYSNLTNFNEGEFVVPGPGAMDGIRKCFSDLGGLNEVEIIKLMTDIQQEEFKKRNLDFKTLWGRRLQLIDCQNLFCEVDKYARLKHPNIKGLSGRTKIKQKYKTNHDPLDYWFPPKWGLNETIKKWKL